MANVFEQAKRKARETSILDVARRHGVLNGLKKVSDEYVGPWPRRRRWWMQQTCISRMRTTSQAGSMSGAKLARG
jgi:hypothetical protein